MTIRYVVEGSDVGENECGVFGSQLDAILFAEAMIADFGSEYNTYYVLIEETIGGNPNQFRIIGRIDKNGDKWEDTEY